MERKFAVQLTLLMASAIVVGHVIGRVVIELLGICPCI